MGDWSGEYEDGKSPLSWTGSVGILEQYWENKKPVKYGQCWVFSGVSTTGELVGAAVSSSVEWGDKKREIEREGCVRRWMEIGERYGSGREIRKRHKEIE